jgi:hypothetical protein
MENQNLEAIKPEEIKLDNQEVIIEQKESVKVTLNAKHQYQYEVKLLEINLKRLKEITDELNKIYNIEKDA